MAPIKLRGMTWNHRRAIDPLVETMPMFRARYPEVEIEWSSRPLSGFEFTPVDMLAKDFDFIILDHPFTGLIAATGCLVPLDDIIAPGQDPFVGPSLESYRLGGSLWAMPVDAACQVAVSRPDLIRALDTAIPANWHDLMALGGKARRKGHWLGIGLSGVHSLMTFFTLMANLGTPCATGRDAEFADRHAASEVLGLMRDLLSVCPAEVLGWNSIELHDQMMQRDDLVFCPAVYCYATYAEADQRRPLRFHDFPGPNGPAGSTIGGTGLGVSAHTRHRSEALAYARFAAEQATQHAFALHHGQPARRDAWQDEAINERFGGCYRQTMATMEACWTRPRYQGYLAFQERAGDLIEAHLRGSVTQDALLTELQRLHAAG
ncbi:extracellular solute-binding protein [Mesorhizobium sp. AR07]|uniref:extracellular solute-binding protein n=1 Tax=Mesorhizobium sp. AR07 TaxID=2865838 RepID=UPI00215F0D5E|nr:extracellular solute-binding protein [Mesorhizobium sp. AR07]UVK43879.1 extracellular solute-binding protein [Mesorhizobium sp. AR07]